MSVAIHTMPSGAHVLLSKKQFVAGPYWSRMDAQKALERLATTWHQQKPNRRKGRTKKRRQKQRRRVDQ